jgi:hypothetical protein
LRATGLSAIANSRSAYAAGRRWQKASIFIDPCPFDVPPRRRGRE